MVDLRRDELRGEQARQILENELYRESWAQMRENIIAKLEQGNLSTDERKLWNDLLVVHGKARKYLANVLTTGTMAAMEMEKQTLAQRAKRVIGIKE